MSGAGEMRKMRKLLSTNELEMHCRNTYAKLEPLAKEDGVYKPLSVYFTRNAPNRAPCSFCYADDKWYHLIHVGDRGEVIIEPEPEKA
jgi:hypothetical protein